MLVSLLLPLLPSISLLTLSFPSLVSHYTSLLLPSFSPFLYPLLPSFSFALRAFGPETFFSSFLLLLSFFALFGHISPELDDPLAVPRTALRVNSDPLDSSPRGL